MSSNEKPLSPEGRFPSTKPRSETTKLAPVSAPGKRSMSPSPGGIPSAFDSTLAKPLAPPRSPNPHHIPQEGTESSLLARRRKSPGKPATELGLLQLSQSHTASTGLRPSPRAGLRVSEAKSDSICGAGISAPETSTCEISPTRERNDALRSPSPMVNRLEKRKSRNTSYGSSLSPDASDSNFIPTPPDIQQEARRRARGRSASPNPLADSLLQSQAPDSKTGSKNIVDESKGEAKRITLSPNLLNTNQGNGRKTTDKIDISYSPSSPLSPRRLRATSPATLGGKEVSRKTDRIIFKGPGECDEDDVVDDKNEKESQGQRRRSRTPRRDIFSPMPAPSSSDCSYKDLLESFSETKLTPSTPKSGGSAASPPIKFPAIRIETVDDSGGGSSNKSRQLGAGDNLGELMFDNDPKGDSMMSDGSRPIKINSMSNSPSSASLSSVSTSPPSPTLSSSPGGGNLLNNRRHGPPGALLNVADPDPKGVDSWLTPTLSPPTSSQRAHPDDARMNWRRKAGSSSTSCLLIVPTPLVQGQTADGRNVVGGRDALAVPGQSENAGRRGMKSRGWSKSEGNLFARAGRPTDANEDGGANDVSELDGELLKGGEGPAGLRRERRREASRSRQDASVSIEQKYTDKQSPVAKWFSPPAVVTPEKDSGGSNSKSRPISGPRPPFRQRISNDGDQGAPEEGDC